MAIPTVLFAASASGSLPIVAAFAIRGRHQPVPYLRVVIWCGVLLSTDILDLAVAKVYGSNLWMTYVTLPVDVGLVLWTLSAWQPNEFLRLTYSLTIPLMGAAAASLLMLTDPAVTFRVWISPFLSLLALAAALHTLVHRSLLSRGLLTDQDWFWVCLGMSLFWLAFVSLPPFAEAFVDTHVEWVRWAYIARAWTEIAAFLLIAWGIVCQRVPARSSGRF